MLPQPTLRLLTSGLFLALAFAAGVAVAADSKLDEAHESTSKAIVLLKSVAAPEGQDGFEAHRKKAIDLLTRAQGEILKAKGE